MSLALALSVLGNAPVIVNGYWDSGRDGHVRLEVTSSCCPEWGHHSSGGLHCSRHKRDGRPRACHAPEVLFVSCPTFLKPDAPYPCLSQGGGRTLLLIASENGHTSVVDMLIAHGATVRNALLTLMLELLSTVSRGDAISDAAVCH